MSLEEVLPLLRMGKKIRREVWPIGTFYVLRGMRLIEQQCDGYERPVGLIHAVDILERDWFAYADEQII